MAVESSSLPEDVDVPSLRDQSEERASRLRLAVEASIGRIFSTGNKVEVLKNGDEIFPSMLEAIGGAENAIEFVTFVYWKGQIAHDFASALARKARSGVGVRVVIDGFGSLPMPDELIEMMKSAGVVVERFRPVVRWKVWESDHRTHRKLLIVDNRIGFTGGVGIAEEWTGDAGGPDEWRDTHFRVEGPAVVGMRAAFLSDWRDCGHSIDISDIDLSVPEGSGSIDMAVIDGSAQIGFNDAERVLEAVIAAAQHRVLVQTPYFNPAPELSELLVAAVERGVAIDVCIPGPHIDKRISAVVAEDCVQPLIAAGVSIWIYQPTMMHVKAVVVDGVLSLVGSVNVNRRSVEKDEEVAVAILDESIATTLEGHFQEDIDRSVPYSPTDKPSLNRRILAKLLGPIKRDL